jgi:hypothetical protein
MRFSGDRGKSDQVIGDQVDGAADRIARQIGIIQSFSNDPLAGFGSGPAAASIMMVTSK